MTRIASNPKVGQRSWAFSPRGELGAALLAGACLGLGVLLPLFPATVLGHAGRWLMWASLSIGMVYGCRAAWAALRTGKFDIDVLMVVGATLAACIDAPGEGALLLFLFVLAGALEDLAMGKTRQAVEALHKLMPTAALRWVLDTGGREPGDSGGPVSAVGGQWLSVAPEALVRGDRIKVLPGESIPADCRMLDMGDQESAVDQASLTGESLPRTVKAGDDLFAGTMNVGNPLEAEVVRPASESSLQKILHMVMSAQEQREPVQRVIDRLSQPYAIAVMAVSISVLIIWWLILGVPLFDRANGGRGALYTAITLLIVASPCAVIISTPTATLAAIARAARAGVLFKGGQSIERLALLRTLALDKTGTLTLGHPTVQHVHAVGWSHAPELLAVAAGLELESTHPIAGAIREAAKLRDIPIAPASRHQFTPGHGVTGVSSGVEARLGTFAHAEPLIPICFRARTRELLDLAQERGQIGIVVAWKDQAGVMVLSDQIRPGAVQLVRELHKIGIEPVIMLTGDNRRTAERIGADVGIDEVHAELMPGDKVMHLGRLKASLPAVHSASRGGRQFGWNWLHFWQSKNRGGVGLIGDGVNDAPALATADVSIAMGMIGSDAALESADIVLLSENLLAVPWAVALARRARRVITFNLVFSLAAIVVMWLVTVIGSRSGFTMPLWAGVLGHEGGTMLVVANSLRLLLARGVHDPSGRVGGDRKSVPLPAVHEASAVGAC